MSNTSARTTLDYKLKSNNNGIYVFVVEGAIDAANQELEKRDALGIYEITKLAVTLITDSKILIIEGTMA